MQKKMGYFYDLEYPTERIAVITQDGLQISYGKLATLCKNFEDQLDKKRKNIILILCSNTYEALCGYLACLRSDNVPLLISDRIDSELFKLIVDKYKPDYFWSPIPLEGNVIFSLGKYTLYKTEKGCIDVKLNNHLALLLSTSGSTGSPKLVRLSKKNLQVSADSICQYLQITDAERPVTVLPMQYVYGISILNSHLNKGATILMTDASIMQKEFWEFIKTNKVTSLCGVPYSYQMYKRLNIFQMNIPTLKTMTQAGGKLSPKLAKEFAEQCYKRNIKFFIMYGQTEATSRMSYLPSDKAIEKCDSIGIAIPGGNFLIIDDNGHEITTPEVVGELVYLGENVMMGYAECSADLSKDYELGGKLFTGDIAKFDHDGYYYIVGRKKRFIKLFGNRVSLDEIEQILRARGYNCACTGIDDKLRVFVTNQGVNAEIRKLLAQITNINMAAFEVIFIETIPINEAGKVLYSKLNEVN